MTAHLQGTWKIQNKVTYSSTMYYNYFLSRQDFQLEFQYQTVKNYYDEQTEKQKATVDLKRTMNQFNIFKIKTKKISWSKSTEIIQSLFSYHYGIIVEINTKRYLKITHIFSSVM